MLISSRPNTRDTRSRRVRKSMEKVLSPLPVSRDQQLGDKETQLWLRSDSPKISNNYSVTRKEYFNNHLGKMSLVRLHRLGLLLQRTGVQFPAPTWQLRAICNSSAGIPVTSSDLHRHGTHTCHTDIHEANPHTHKIIR